MARTEATVRAQILTTLRANKADFGLDDNSAIKGYLLENHHPQELEGYLFNDVSSSKTLRAIGVQVIGQDDPFRTTLIAGAVHTVRKYTITTKFYSELGQDGAGEQNIIDWARAVRNRLMALGTSLNQTVTCTDAYGPVEVESITVEGAMAGGTDADFFLEGTMIIEATDEGATF